MPIPSSETTSSEGAVARVSSATLPDCLFVMIAALLPVILCIHRLGFYADDWGLFAFFRAAGGRTVRDYFRIFHSLPITHARPAQVLYEAVLFRVFATHPLGYHVVNSLVFVTSACLCYLSLRRVLRNRLLALAIPLLFVLLPNYSSARFVPFANMVGLSMVFFFLNLYALLKATQGSKPLPVWTAISVAALVISGLAYEVALPVVAFSMLVAWYIEHQKPVPRRISRRAMPLILLLNSAGLVGVLIFKTLTTTRYHGVAPVSSVVLDSVEVHFYELGLRLPIVVLKVIVRSWNPAVFALAALAGVFMFWYLRGVTRQSDLSWFTFRRAVALLACGVVVFALGNAIFLVAKGEVGFTATGVGNRIAIAAGLGMAIIFSGVVMLLSALSKKHREVVSALLFAILSSCCLLVTGTIASYWAAAADQQQAILRSIRQVLPTLPPKTTLLVGGFCPFLGPGIVFEGPGDIGGAIQLLYGDPTLLGDVVTPRLEIKPHAVQSRIYQSLHYYPYGPGLKLYDLRRRTVATVSDFDSAREYLGITGPSRSFCPEGEEGYGVTIF